LTLTNTVTVFKDNIPMIKVKIRLSALPKGMTLTCRASQYLHACKYSQWPSKLYQS